MRLITTRLAVGSKLKIAKFVDALSAGSDIEATVELDGTKIKLQHTLSARQIANVKSGSVINKWNMAREVS